MSEWRSIETAPRDGTRVIVLHEGRAFIAFWGAKFARGQSEVIGWMSDYKVCQYRPTMWQPLPDPPEA